ncbi:MAG: sigma-70 family RNA polymerase sigma factor [Dictyoglomus sp.]|nr:sigma-70 family RNA polymerase sigma factor [Dictyoglomus sp.]MCX7942114.1 sigma-70 family RNA polymerase sigma factor [Dictyoglomaceae bacterium]MDW8188332.1 sigma-70 family RNA polymerase sigma factor [Dictyoglomus sp.]
MDYNSLYLAYKPLLYKYLYLLHSKEIEWEDWKQQGETILLQLLKKHDETKGSLSSYLKKSLYYELLHYKKKIISQNNYYENLAFENYELERKINLRKLSKREREVINLLYFSRYSERETAKYLKISRRSVRTYKKRALNKLKVNKLHV